MACGSSEVALASVGLTGGDWKISIGEDFIGIYMLFPLFAFSAP